MDREAMLKALREAGHAVDDSITDDALKLKFTEAIKPKEPEKKVEPVIAPEKKIDLSEAEKKAQENLDRLTKLTEAAELREYQAQVQIKLSESKLPIKLQAKLKDKFTATITDLDVVSNEISLLSEAITEAAGPGRVTGFGVTKGDMTSPDDKYQAALDGMIDGKDAEVNGSKVPRFRGLQEAFRKTTGLENYENLHSPVHFKRINESVKNDSMMVQMIEASHISSTFSLVLGDSITRKLLAKFQSDVLLDAWRRVVQIDPDVSNFRTQRRNRIGGFGALPIVAEEGTYLPVTVGSDEEATYAMAKRGRLMPITFEMVKNDDVRAIRQMVELNANDAAITLFRFVFDFFVDNAATTYDSVAFFHASHGNLGSTALSSSSLSTTRIAMRSQAAFNNSIDLLGLVPDLLLISNENEENAFNLRTSKTLVGATNNAGQERNFHQGTDSLVIDYWTDANDWVALSSKMPPIEIAFLDGQEQPEVLLQDTANVGSVFTSDKITYKIRHIYNAAVIEHRSAYKHVVA